MNYTDYRISLDIFKTVSQDTLPVKQGDTAYRLCINITANGSPYVIAEGCYALFTAKKPDGNFINNKCTIENNTIYYQLTKQTTAAIGIVECEIVLYDANDEQLATPHFNIFVDVKAYNGEEIKSSSEVNMLEDLIKESEAQIAEVENKLENGEFKGEKGDAGVIKFIPVNELPEENIDENAIYLVPAENIDEQNIYEEFVYINGNWESLGTVPVEIDLSDYVKKTQFADNQGNAGILRLNSNYGITSGRYNASSPITGDTIIIQTPSNGLIKQRTQQYMPITPSNIDYAVKCALAYSKLDWTEKEKKAARILLGVATDEDLGIVIKEARLGEALEFDHTFVKGEKYKLTWYSPLYGGYLAEDVELVVEEGYPYGFDEKTLGFTFTRGAYVDEGNTYYLQFFSIEDAYGRYAKVKCNLYETSMYSTWEETRESDSTITLIKVSE